MRMCSPIRHHARRHRLLQFHGRQVERVHITTHEQYALHGRLGALHFARQFADLAILGGKCVVEQFRFVDEVLCEPIDISIEL